MRPFFSYRRRTVALIAPFALLTAFGACQESTVPNFNTPNIEGLLNSPDAARRRGEKRMIRNPRRG